MSLTCEIKNIEEFPDRPVASVSLIVEKEKFSDDGYIEQCVKACGDAIRLKLEDMRDDSDGK